MTRGKKWAIGVVLVLATAVGITWVKVPEIIRWYVRDNYANVDPKGAIEVHWSEEAVTFSDVDVKRPGLSGTLYKVHVDSAKNVTVTGGRINLNNDFKRGGGSGGAGSGATITAKGLIITVGRDDLSGFFEGVSVNDREVCVDHARFNLGDNQPEHIGDISVEKGCGTRDKTSARAANVAVAAILPRKVPRIEPVQLIVAEGVQLSRPDPKDCVGFCNPRVVFDKATIGPPQPEGDGFTREFASTVAIVERGYVTRARTAWHAGASDIEVRHPWIAPTPMSFESVKVMLPRGETDEKARVHLGKASIIIDPDTQAVEGDEECADWFDAFPRPLPKAMTTMAEHFTGRLRFEVRAKPTPFLEIKNTCKFKCSEPPIKGLVGKRFTYLVYDKDNNLVERTTGPGVPGWVPLRALPEYVLEAFRLMEDPGFLNHKGISRMALQNSLKANLESGKFVKGGSTITMQLAKNLWLRRHKTITRKANEALLTLALESCLSKQRILELYVNVVEFGPDLYGIGPASKHYFKKYPSELTPDEAFYLASILPKPRHSLPPHSGGLDRAKRIMTRLANSGYISAAFIPIDDAELADDGSTGDWQVLDD